jgi:imidazoleglycerol-phosphate dehydratase
MSRRAEISRKTRETAVELALDLDGGEVSASTGVGFLDHMLELLGRHGRLGLGVKASGDLETGAHHTVEDVGIALGRALADALGDAKGIVRMGDALVPLDESLAQVAVDLSGRAHAVINVTWNDVRVGELPCDLYEHFLESLANEGRFNLHARILAGGNDHHKAESLMKALARSLSAATRIDPRRAGQTPSTKGTLG